MTKEITLSNYDALLGAIKEEIAAGKARIHEAIEREKVITYWRVGELLSNHLLEHKKRADYGEYLFEKLSIDLAIDRRTLERSVRFYELFPIAPARAQLTWSHYRALISIDNDKKRKELEQKAIKEKWASRDLEAAIKAEHVATTKTLFDRITPATALRKGTPRLSVRRASLYTYRLIKPEHIHAAENALVVDLGFNMRHEISSHAAGHFAHGAIVTSQREEAGSYAFASAAFTKKELYTYKAHVERIIDGDTLWLMIDCGFAVWARQKVRLRGIDTAETGTKKGEEATAFVTAALAASPFIVIKTHGRDKYDRYLTDIFYPSPLLCLGASGAAYETPQTVLGEGLFLNQQLLDEGLARRAE